MFDKVNKEHILQGIRDYKERGLPNGFGPSITYDLVVDDVNYPPKAIMAYANYHASGRKIERYFKGGEGTPCFLRFEKLGFNLKLKAETSNSMNVKEEFAGWLLENGASTYKQYYGDTINDIVNKLNEINNFFFDKDLFLVSKDSYQSLKRYLLDNIYGENRQSNVEFNSYDQLKGNGRPKAILGRQNYFKFLDEKFQEGQTNYWVFQGNPNIYDINSALRQGHVKSWKVAAHKESIKPGDKVILWQTGDEAGCYALGKVISEVDKIREEEDELQYYLVPSVSNDTNDTERVQLEIITNLVERPILWSLIKDNPVFENFKAGNQGTNFSATEKEFKTLAKMVDTVRFSWVETHKQLAQYLVGKQDQQKELIALLKRAGATEFNDNDSEDRIIDLEEIDPFTFFCYIYKYGPKKRLKILQNIAKELNFTVPIDESGVPSSNAQKVWLFPFGYFGSDCATDFGGFVPGISVQNVPVFTFRSVAILI